MELAIKNVYNGLNIYNQANQRVFTRNEIGAALGYKDPRDAIAKIHRRHKTELDPCQGVVKLSTPQGIQETYIYNYTGVVLICKYSSKPNAAAMLAAIAEYFQRISTTQPPNKPRPAKTKQLKAPDSLAPDREYCSQFIADNFDKYPIKSELLRAYVSECFESDGKFTAIPKRQFYRRYRQVEEQRTRIY